MIAQTSAVNMDAKYGNLMEITVSDGKPHNSHHVNVLYKQECDHGTCLVFPWITFD